MQTKKRGNTFRYYHVSFFLLRSGGRTRTCGLWVMSPTSYQLLHPASSNTPKLFRFDTTKVCAFFELTK